MEKNILKIIFIDTNVFINCVFKEDEDLGIDTIDQIIEKLNGQKTVLILPEIIKTEVIEEIHGKFINLIKYIEERLQNESLKNSFKNTRISHLFEETVKENKNEIIKKINKIEDSILKKVNEIFNHKNTKRLTLSEKLILAGMKRSLLKLAPYSNPNVSSKKTAYIKDVDCIAFESLLEYINKNSNKKKSKIIICTNDIDYFENFEKNKLCSDILKDINNKNVSAYTNPLEMLNKEFDKQYSREQLNKYAATTTPDFDLVVPNSSFTSIPLASTLSSVDFSNLSSLNSLSSSTNWYSPSSFSTSKNIECPYCGTKITLPSNNLENITYSMSSGSSFKALTCPNPSCQRSFSAFL